MTSAQLILVSVSSALIAVITMLVVATVLRARTREGTGTDVSQATGPQTRAQRAAARAQTRAQRATMRADKKAAKAAASVTKSEKKKAAAAALAAAKTEPADRQPASGTGSEGKEKAAKDEGGPKTKDAKSKAKKDAAEDKDAGGKSEGPAASGADEDSAAPDKTDELVVPEARGRLGGTAEQEPDEEVATTEAGKRAAEAKPKTRRSLLGRERMVDDSEKKG